MVTTANSTRQTARAPVDPLQEQPAPPDRVAYGLGVMLDADDFRDEQQYHRGRLARALAYLFGSGTVAGLRVLCDPPVLPVPTPGSPEPPEQQLIVEPGLALDRLGRMIEVPRRACLRLDHWYRQQAVDDLVQGLHTAEPFSLPAGSVLRLTVNGVDREITFTTSNVPNLRQVTAAQINGLLTAAGTGAGAAMEDGRLVLRTATTGTTFSLAVRDAGATSAHRALNLPAVATGHVGPGGAEQPARVIGGVPPFRLQDGRILALAVNGGEHELRFTASGGGSLDGIGPREIDDRFGSAGIPVRAVREGGHLVLETVTTGALATLAVRNVTDSAHEDLGLPAAAATAAGPGEDASVRAGAALNGVVVDVFVRFVVCERGRTAAFASGPFDALDAVQPSRLRDGYELSLVIRKEGAPPLPGARWPALAAIADLSDRRDALHEAIFGAWREGSAWWTDDGPVHLPEHAVGQDPTALFLARIVIPATGSSVEQRPERTPGAAVRVENGMRRFVYAADALARWAGI